MNDIARRITRCYEEDQEQARLAVRRTDIPTSYEAITPEWLTAILCAAHPGAEVVSYRLGPPDNGSANRRRLFLTYNQEGDRAGLPLTIFCKASHSLQNRLMLGINGCLHSETVFYTKIAPMLDIRVPKSYFAAYDPARYIYIVLLEDLGHRVEFCHHRTTINRSRVDDQLGLLARIHGRFHEYPGLLGAEFNLLTFPQFWDNVVSNNLEEYSKRGFKMAEPVIPTALFNQFHQIWPATTKSVERHRELPHTLMHGDCHLKNWYIDSDGGMSLCDWQTTAAGHWSRDFAYAMTTALTVEDRRAWDRDLLRLYLDLLRKNGGPKVEFEEAWRHYRQQLMSVLAYWTVTLTPSPSQPDMQPEDTTLEFIKRIAHAIDDNDSLSSFD